MSSLARPDPDWEARLAAHWESLDAGPPADFVARLDTLLAELPAGHPAVLFERAATLDATGRPAEALPLYEAALAAGLKGLRRRFALIRSVAERAKPAPPRQPIFLMPGQGRAWPMGRIAAVFKADEAETASKYSISEWWLDPHTQGPGTHQRPEDDVFYVLDGVLNLSVPGPFEPFMPGIADWFREHPPQDAGR